MSTIDDEIENAFFIGMKKLDQGIFEVEEHVSLGSDQEEIDFYMDQVGEKAVRLAKRWGTMQYIL